MSFQQPYHDNLVKLLVKHKYIYTFFLHELERFCGSKPCIDSQKIRIAVLEVLILGIIFVGI